MRPWPVRETATAFCRKDEVTLHIVSEREMSRAIARISISARYCSCTDTGKQANKKHAVTGPAVSPAQRQAEGGRQEQRTWKRRCCTWCAELQVMETLGAAAEVARRRTVALTTSTWMNDLFHPLPPDGQYLGDKKQGRGAGRQT